MTRAEASGLQAIVDLVTNGLVTALGPAANTRAGAAARQAIGEWNADLEANLAAGTLCTDLLACFTALSAVGPTFTTLEILRTAIAGAAPIGQPATILRAVALQFALAGEARTIAATAFVSRDDVDAVAQVVHPAFEGAEDAAAEAGSSAVYRALVSLHAAVTRDLTTRSRPLPRLVTYTVNQPLPTLTLAQRLYGDGSRADEVTAENKIKHPLFAPVAGRALSA